MDLDNSTSSQNVASPSSVGNGTNNSHNLGSSEDGFISGKSIETTKQNNSQNMQQNQCGNNLDSNKINGKISRNSNEISGGNHLLTNINANNGGNGTSKTSENNKRKKTKSRSTNGSLQQQSQINYPKNHLDAWLETCFKDSNTPQLSSSSEFLDYNTSSFAATNQTNKKPVKNTPKLQQQFFIKSSAYPAPFSQGFQKTVPDNRNLTTNPYYFNNLMRNSNAMINDASCDFASLPPIVNLTNSGNENNVADNIFDINDPTRRFSDPCLINPSDNEGSKPSGQNTPNLKDNSNPNNSNSNSNNKLFLTLMEQINLLHETNSKICRNLHDTKVDIEALKNSPNWGGMRHRRDSLSGLSTHSQPMHMGGFAFGTQSPAPTYHSGMYTPGMMTDVVREVKEAARVREDALLSRVKSMVEERSWSQGENNLRMMRDIEEMKAQIQQLRGDRKDANKRITQLEGENKYMKQILGSLLNNRTNEIIHENEFSRSTPIQRRSTIIPEPSIATTSSATAAANAAIANRQKRNSFNINYGIINHEDSLSTAINSPNERKSSTPYENRSNISNNSTNRHPNTQYNGQLRITENFYPTAQDNDISTNITSDSDQQVIQMEKDTLDLRRDLQEAIASKKDAENRIIALEKVVKKLQLNEDKHSSNIRNNGSGNDTYSNHHFLNGSTRHNSSNSGEILLSQNPNTITHHITSQMQGIPSKLSLAGPITDL